MSRHIPAPDLSGNERRTRLVVLITLVTMVVELVVGHWTRSMALTADGWHMGTHAGALGLTLFGYWFARSRDGDARFNFGTGKVFSLTAFASAIILGLVSLEIVLESGDRLLSPVDIDFNQALPVAVVGLVVNLVCAVILQNDDAAHHGHSHGHGHGHGHAEGRDQNLRAAYFHVLADALTSLCAIIALLAGKYFGWSFLDPLMGVVGGVVILRWAWSLSQDSCRQLLDTVPDAHRAAALRATVEEEGVAVEDLYLWSVGPGQLACAVSVAAPEGHDPLALRARLSERLPEQERSGLVLVLIEIREAAVGVSDGDLRHHHDHDHHAHGHSHHH